MDNAENTGGSTPPKSGGNFLVPAAVVGLIVIVAVGIFLFQGQQKNEKPAVVGTMTAAPTASDIPTKAMTSESESSDSATPDTAKTQEYKDGTYTAVGNYTSPGGAETIGVTVTLKDDIIVSSEVSTENAQRPNTIKFQGIFKANYEPLVVGKDIDEVKLDKVSSSSLAPKGFNDALEKIKTEAKA